MKFNSEKTTRLLYGDSEPGRFRRMMANIFQWLVKARRNLYRLGLLKVHHVKVPVIVVGNITVGGGGKTPVVIWLVDKLRSMGYRPGVISRGYGGKRKVEPMLVTPHASAAATGDEPLLIAKKADVPVFVAKKRANAARQLIQQYPIDCVISDDGMQHYALHRDAEILMLDAQLGLGNELSLPAGPLRESKERMDTVNMVLYKGVREGSAYYRYYPDVIYQLNKSSVTRNLRDFRNQKLHAMAGIANPDSFFTMLSEHGLAVIKTYLPDHHEWSETDFDFDDDYPILITEKDAIKCSEFGVKNVWVVSMSIEMNVQAENELNELIRGVFC